MPKREKEFNPQQQDSKPPAVDEVAFKRGCVHKHD